MTETGPSVLLTRRSLLVEDADEEIFLLYTRKQQSGMSNRDADAGGLGFHSDAGDLLHLDVEIDNPWQSQEQRQDTNKRQRQKGKQRRRDGASFHVEVELHQSLANLRHRAGDTGSVMWRLSLYLAKFLLSSHHFPHPAHPPLLPRLGTSTVLELGSGTGFLGIALRSIFDARDDRDGPRRGPRDVDGRRAQSKWTFSDQLENLGLIARNLRANSIPSSEIGDSPLGRYSIVELDWLVESREYLASRGRPRVRPSDDDEERGRRDGPDVILAVDCIYNPSLSVALAHTIVHRSDRSTVVVVASELRDPEPLELFLASWLAAGREKFGPDGGWTVARLDWDADDADEARLVGELGDPKFVVWIASCSEYQVG